MVVVGIITHIVFGIEVGIGIARSHGLKAWGGCCSGFDSTFGTCPI